MKNFIQTILEQMNHVCKSQEKFITNLFLAMLIFRGKANFRNLSRYVDMSEKTFSRNFKKEFDFVEFNKMILKPMLSGSGKKILAYDPSFVKKSGKKTYGKEYFWNGSQGQAERGLELSLIGIVDVEENKAYALSAKQTPSLQEIKMDDPDASRVDAYLKQLQDLRPIIPKDISIVAVDAFFAKEKYVSGVCKMNLDVVGKLRIDANLRYLYTGPQKDRGRHRCFDGKVDINNLGSLDFYGQVDKETRLYTAIVNSVSLRRNIRIILSIQKDNKNRALMFSTDLSLSALEIYVYYKARFQIEFVFRDAKQFTGLVDCQARCKKSLDFHFNSSFSALNLVKIRDATEKSATTKSPFSMASWKLRFYNEKLLNSIFSMLDQNQTLKKSHISFQEIRNYGVTQM